MKKYNLGKSSAIIFFGVLACALMLNAIPKALAPTFTSTVQSCKENGTPQTYFHFTESVWARGRYYQPGQKLTIYVMPEGLSQALWTASNSVGSATTYANAAGYLEPTELGTFPVGDYDIWVDINDNQIYEVTEPHHYLGCTSGFHVIPEYLLGTLLGIAGCFAAFGVFHLSKQKHKY